MADRFLRSQTAPSAKAVVALVHGLAEYQGRYAHVVAALGAAGYDVHMVDLAGHGRSGGFPGLVGGHDDWVDDVSALVDQARRNAGERPLFLIGHSLGALVSATYVARHPDSVEGLVLSGLAVLAGTALLAAMSDPSAPGLPPEAVSRDPEVVRTYAEDPLVFHDRVPPEANAAALAAAIEVNQSGPLVTVPVLMVHGGDDGIADVEGARELFAQLGSRDRELIVYDALYHEVMNEPEKDRVISDIVGWLDRHVPA
jgi:alpha-beta hydrolase superfamily lysophospholipase